MRLRAAIVLLSLFAVATILVPPASGQAANQLYTASRVQLDVTKVVIAQQAAWNKGDLDGFLKHYKDDLTTEAVLAGPIRGLPNIRASFHANYPTRESMGQIENTEVEVRELGENFALATGRYHLARSKKGGGDAEGTFLSIMEKTAAGWQVIFTENT